MTETARTAAFAAVAAVSVAVAAFLSWPGPTPETAGFEQVGTPFFTAFAPDADDPDAAGNLSKIGRFTITAFDPDTGAIQEFRVTRNEETGLYGLSPYGYPAEAAEKLAEVATALGSVERTALQSRRESDWADLGVVDPASEDVDRLEGRGLRIELTGDDGNTLADLIIGNAVEGRDGYFYVREPRDDSTYIAKLEDLGLSAAFADWIDPQVLDVQASEVRRIALPAEVLDAAAGTISLRDPLTAVRDGAAGEWAPAPDTPVPAGQQIDQAAANELARTVTGLRIVGVRPKPAGLQPDLRVSDEVAANPIAMRLIRDSLLDKGFVPVEVADGRARVMGAAGEVTVVAADGVAYDLAFGELFTGTSHDFAVGDAGEGYKTLEAKSDGKTDEEGDDETDAEEESRGRYLFVTARLDAAALGEPPVEPQAPAAESDGAESGADEEASEDGETDDAQAQYEQDLAAYRTAKAEYDRKLADAAERVEELNRRYGDWYYVVDAADVAELSLRPAALLTDAPAPEPADGEGAAPAGTSPIEAPGNLQDLINGLSPGMGNEPTDAPQEEPAEAPAPAPQPAADAATEDAAMTEDAAAATEPPAPVEGSETEPPRTPVTAPRPTGTPETPDPTDEANADEGNGNAGSPEESDDAGPPADEGANGGD
ncbi:DUF4340 domain-containing protein [Alienimonas sp. DA493]|uniref:DUF4340 domain-containing protein n=1 Tax=Alienimonas sp. DA493 TaxID=3373605 RepID=UPI003754F944